MSQGELDRIFDEALERAQIKKPNRGAYSEGPLAADHFLLSRSWAYFRSRLQTLEAQWKKIVSSKESQINALKEELRIASEKWETLAQDNKELRSFEQAVIGVRIKDHLDFSEDNRGLILQWNEERQKLEEQRLRAESEARKKEEMFRAQLTEKDKRLKELNSVTEGLKKDNERLVLHQQKVQKEFEDSLRLKDQEIHALDTKVDLLRAEVQHRDQLIKKYAEQILQKDRDVHERQRKTQELTRSIEALSAELRHLQTRYAILQEEKNNLKLGWEREQAQWREMWDRQRLILEKQQASFKSARDRKAA